MQPFEMVMNPKQVFLSVLIFGVAGLLLFMYLQVWIEEQHTEMTQNICKLAFSELPELKLSHNSGKLNCAQACVLTD
ncbi:PREDICTED: carbohydrate sulfotransferase 9-like [Rhinopithecus bieti]|uniref:carbohydrate sulfotransferase 9-like n=1 Tax=Rhinopithecus bieti TaxID=61621 RepID=UPI00083C38C8|nr:PREDICTED: carbohydrate sulfotransferase 9-like [Rhinopithecus bieti]